MSNYILTFVLLLIYLAFAQQCHEAQEIVVSQSSEISMDFPVMKFCPLSLTGCGDFKQHYVRWFKVINNDNSPIQVNITYFPQANLHVVDSCKFEKCIIDSVQTTNTVVIEGKSSVLLAFFKSTPPLQSTLKIESKKYEKIVNPIVSYKLPETKTTITITKVPTNVYCGTKCKISIDKQRDTVKIGSCDNEINHISAICESGNDPLEFLTCSNGYTTALLRKNSGECKISLGINKPTSVTLRKYKPKDKTIINNNNYEELITTDDNVPVKNYEIKTKKGQIVSVNTFNEKGLLVKPILYGNKDNYKMECNPNGICTLYKKVNSNENVNIGIGLSKVTDKTKINIHVGNKPFRTTPTIKRRNTLTKEEKIIRQAKMKEFNEMANENPLLEDYKEGGSKQYVFLSIGMVVFILIVGLIAFVFQPNTLFRYLSR